MKIKILEILIILLKIKKIDFNNNLSNMIVSLFVNSENKDINIKDFHSFCKDKRINFKDNFGNITVSLFVGIENNISIYIVEVPNETAPSIQGFAKPPA